MNVFTAVFSARRCWLGMLFLTSAMLAHPAAADTTGCTGITTLPKNITVPGHYCLASGLSWAGTTGAAIKISADNVVLDCNDNMISFSGTAQVYGVLGSIRSDVEIRHCRFKNFYRGVYLYGENHRLYIHDNYITSSRYSGIAVYGRDFHVNRNYVTDTAGPYAILANVSAGGSASLNENFVSNVTGTAASLNGIIIAGGGRATLVDNFIRGVGRATTSQSSAYSVASVTTLTPSPAVIKYGVAFKGLGVANYAVSKATGVPSSVCKDVTAVGYPSNSTPGCL